MTWTHTLIQYIPHYIDIFLQRISRIHTITYYALFVIFNIHVCLSKGYNFVCQCCRVNQLSVTNYSRNRFIVDTMSLDILSVEVSSWHRIIYENTLHMIPDSNFNLTINIYKRVKLSDESKTDILSRNAKMHLHTLTMTIRYLLGVNL